MATLQQELGPLSSLCDQPFAVGMPLCSPLQGGQRLAVLLACHASVVRGARGHGGKEHVQRKTLSLACTSWQSSGTFLGLPSEQQHAGSLGLPGRGRDAEGSRAAVKPAARGGAHGGTGILFEQQVGEIHTAFNQAASFRL